MKRLAIALLLACTACGPTGPDLAQSADHCRYGSRPFIEAWPCVRDTFATRQDSNPGIQATFLAKGDLIWQRAKEGQITEAEARAEMRLAAAEARAAEDAANGTAAAASAPIDAAVLGGMMNRSQPQVAPVRQPINCVRMGNFVNCY